MKFPDTLEEITHLILLYLLLGNIVDVLILAAAAGAKMFAARFYTVGRCLKHVDEFCSGEGFLFLGDFHQNRFPADDERDEDDKPIHSANTFTAEGQVIDF